MQNNFNPKFGKNVQFHWGQDVNHKWILKRKNIKNNNNVHKCKTLSSRISVSKISVSFRPCSRGLVCVCVETAFMLEFFKALQWGFLGLFPGWYLHRCLLDLCSGNGHSVWVFSPLAQRSCRSNIWATSRVNSAAACLKIQGGTMLAEVEQSHPAPAHDAVDCMELGEDALSGSSPAVSPVVPTLPCLAMGKLFAAGTALWGSCLPGRALTPSWHSVLQSLKLSYQAHFGNR